MTLSAAVPSTSAPATWVNDADALRDWLAPVGDGDVVGLDTEFTRRNTFYSKLALLQLSHQGRHALVDPLAFDLADIVQQHVGQRDVICVMHSAGEDLETLAPWLPTGPSTLFDTQIAAAFVGLGYGLGYRSLVAALCDVELDKGETRSDWEQRPLREAQKRYAVLDVVYLESVYQQLQAKLASAGKLDWFRADCEQLKQRARVDDYGDQLQRDLPAAAAWPRSQQALLRRVLCWREQAAREWDKPRNWLLDSAHALELISHPPVDVDALAMATRGLRALRAPQRQQLFERLQGEPNQAEIAATRLVPDRLHGHAKDLVARMKREVATVADNVGLPSGLLCSRKYIEALVADREWPDGLDGWRRDLLYSRLMPLLPD